MSINTSGYGVYNEKNQYVVVEEEQIDLAFNNKDTRLPVEIIAAIGLTHNPKYLTRLYEAIEYSDKKQRECAIKSIINIGDTQSIEILKKRLDELELEEKKESEYYILKVAILLFEQGTNRAIEYFLNENEDESVKLRFIDLYTDGYNFKNEDLMFIIIILKETLNRSQEWIKNLDKEDYEEAIIWTLEVLWRISESTQLLLNIDKDSYQDLLNICNHVFMLKIDSYAKEIIAIFARGLSKERAYEVLKPIMGKARGDVKKELKRTLKILEGK